MVRIRRTTFDIIHHRLSVRLHTYTHTHTLLCLSSRELGRLVMVRVGMLGSYYPVRVPIRQWALQPPISG